MSVEAAPSAPAAPPMEPGQAPFSAAFRGNYFWLTVTTLSGILIGSLDQYIVSTAMPRILEQLHEPAFYAWVTSAFILSQVVGLSLGGAWKDRAGLRTPFITAVAIFGIGSLSCGFAPSMPALVAARAFQGLGGVGITAVCFAAAAGYPEALRLRMFSLTSTVWGIVSLLGPVLGGVITDGLGWRWIFFVNVPICFLVILLAVRGFATAGPADRTRPLPVMRAVLLALAAGSIVAAPSTTWRVAGPLLVIGILLAWVYVKRERRAAVPIVPLSTWSGRGPVGSSMRATLFFTASFMGSSVFLPLYLQGVRGESATQAGLVLTVGGVSWTIGSIFSSQARGPWPKRMVIIGSLLIVGDGLFIAAQAMPGNLPLALIYVAWSLAAVGIGMAMVHLMNWAIVFSPPEQSGTVSGAVQTVRMLGAACGGALMGALLQGIGADPGHLRISIAAIFLLVAFVAIWPATLGQPHGIERRPLQDQAGIAKGIEAVA